MQKYLQAADMEMPENLTVARQTEFNKVLFDFIADAATNEIYVFDEQVGVALEYKPPVAMLHELHERHSDRVDPYAIETTVYTLRSVKRLKRKLWLYSLRAISEMCRWSRQPMVDAFLDFIWNEIENIKHQRNTPLLRQEEIIERSARQLADILFPQFAQTLTVSLPEQIIEQIKNTDVQREVTSGPEQVLALNEDLPLSALPQTLTILHIKKYLDIGQRQAYELMRSEGFPAFHVGSSVKVERRYFEKWLDKMAGTAHVSNK